MFLETGPKTLSIYKRENVKMIALFPVKNRKFEFKDAVGEHVYLPKCKNMLKNNSILNVTSVLEPLSDSYDRIIQHRW